MQCLVEGSFGSEDFILYGFPVVDICYWVSSEPALGSCRQVLAGLGPSAAQAKRLHTDLITEGFAFPQVG